MNRIRGIVSLFVGLLFLPAPTAQAADVNKYLPNDTEIVVSFNVRQVLDSKLVTKHALEMLKGLIDSNEDAKKILKSLEFDPLKDIEKLTIASAPVEAASDKGLIILQGKFDVAKFEGKIEEHAKKAKDEVKTHRIGTKKVFEIQTPETEDEKSKTFFFTFLDNKTIVASPNKDYVAEAVEKEAGKKDSKINADLKTLIENIDGNLSFWGIGLSKALAKSMQGEEKDVFNKFTSVSLGLHITDEVKAQLVMSAKDAKVAKELSKDLADMMDQVKTMIAGVPIPNNKEVLDLLDTLKVTVKDNDVILKGRISSDLIEKAIPN